MLDARDREPAPGVAAAKRAAKGSGCATPRSGCACLFGARASIDVDLSQACSGHDPDSDSRGRMKALIVDDEATRAAGVAALAGRVPVDRRSWARTGNVDEAAGKVAVVVSRTCCFWTSRCRAARVSTLLARLDYAPQVVFTTAHDEHAVRAFEVNALDYVLEAHRSRAPCCHRIASQDMRRPRRSQVRRWSRSSSRTGLAAGSCRCARCAC